jgi:hypothetical protein
MSEQTATPAVEETQAQEVSLSLSDIDNAVKVIDFAHAQGAFRDWDTVEKVLLVRKRLAAFVEVATAQQAGAQAEAAEVTEAAEEAPEVQG